MINIAEYQMKAQARGQFERLVETYAVLRDRHGEMYAMTGLVGMLMNDDISEVASILAAAVARAADD